jgi:hypothetical protein
MGGLRSWCMQAARSNTPVIAVDHPRVKRQKATKPEARHLVVYFFGLLGWLILCEFLPHSKIPSTKCSLETSSLYHLSPICTPLSFSFLLN